jgi:para-nitrobenzyl esterase
MSTAWINFAKTGDPNHKGLPVWPRYNEAVGATMLFDNVSTVKNHPDKEILDLVAGQTPGL